MSASGKSSGKGGMPSPGGGKGGGETSPTPMPGMPTNYNVANDVYGSGLTVNQPMSGYYNQFPAPGNNYAPPVYPDPPKPPPVVNDPNAGMIPKPGYINNSPEMQSAYGAGAGNQASANELAAFNLGVPDVDGDGRLSDDEFTSWDGYGAYSQKNGSGILLSAGPGGSDGSRFTGEYGADGKPIYTSGFTAAPAVNNQQYGGYSPYGGGYSSPYYGQQQQSQYRQFKPARQTVRPGQIQSQSQASPFDQLIAQATNQQLPAQAETASNGNYSYNHPVYGQIDNLTQEGLQSMIRESGGFSGIY